MAENQFTLADILMYYGIHPIIVSYTFICLFTHSN